MLIANETPDNIMYDGMPIRNDFAFRKASGAARNICLWHRETQAIETNKCFVSGSSDTKTAI